MPYIPNQLHGFARRTTVAAVLFALACSDTTNPGTAFLGTYQLETIDGTPVPVGAILGGSFVLRADLTCSDRLRSTTGDADRACFFSGITGPGEIGIVYHTSGGVERSAVTVDGDSLTRTIDGAAYVYRRPE